MNVTRELQLTRGKVALIDAADFERVRGLAWQAINPKGKWYARHMCSDGTAIMLGRYLLDAPPGMVVDYVNGDTLDNRRANIRLCSRAQDNANARTRKHNRTGLKGVKPSRGRFRARITVNGTAVNLGTFDTPEEAHAAYVAAAERHFGVYARAK